MESLSKLTSTRLEWIQPRRSERAFELKAGGEVVATLAFKSAFGTMAAAEAAGGRWTFKRVGFLNPRVTVREAGSEADRAVFHARWLGDGRLEFDYGAAFRWESTNFWATEWRFAAADGTPLVTLHPGLEKEGLSDLFKTQAHVEITAGGAKAPELPVLVLLGWYLMILRQADAAAVAIF